MAINFAQSLQALLGKVGLGGQQQPVQNAPPAAQVPQSFKYAIKPGGQLKGTDEIVYSNGKTWPEMDFMEQWNAAMGQDYQDLVGKAAASGGQAPPPQFVPPLIGPNHPWIKENPQDYGKFAPKMPPPRPPSPGNMQGYVPPTSSHP